MSRVECRGREEGEAYNTTVELYSATGPGGPGCAMWDVSPVDVPTATTRTRWMVDQRWGMVLGTMRGETEARTTGASHVHVDHVDKPGHCRFPQYALYSCRTSSLMCGQGCSAGVGV